MLRYSGFFVGVPWQARITSPKSVWKEEKVFCGYSFEFSISPIALFSPVNLHPHQFYKSLLILMYTAAPGAETRLFIFKNFSFTDFSSK